MSPASIDRDRQRVYDTEGQVRRLFERPGGALDGQPLPLERRFADRIAVGRYCEALVSHPQVRAAVPGLPGVLITTSRAEKRARYMSGRDEILMPATIGWADRELVVLHELAHHLVHHSTPGDGEEPPAHGQEFRSAYCALVRVAMGPVASDALRRSYRGAGLAVDVDTAPTTIDLTSDRMTRRIAALLNKAESTTSSAEAEACLAKAHELARLHAIDIDVLTRLDTGAEHPAHRQIQIGEPRRPHSTYLVALFVGVARLNDVRLDVARNSTYVIAYGYESDIAVCERLFTAIAVHMSTAVHHYLTGGTWRGTTYLRLSRDAWATGTIATTHTARSARLAFYQGYVDRILQRLDEADRGASSAPRRRSAAPTGDPGAATGLQPAAPAGGDHRRDILLARKRERVDSYHREHSNARGAYRSTTSIGPGSAAHAAGRAAADQTRLHADAALGTPRGITQG